MKKLNVVAVCSLLLAFSTGCPSRSDIDAGLPFDGGVRTDGGDDAGHDAGNLPDSGTPGVDGGIALKVANWNLEWFGDNAGNGVADPALQYTNVIAVLKSAPDVDIWGLEEVVSASEFSGVTAALDGFTGILARDVGGGSSYYSLGEQKVALLFRSSKVTLNGTPKLILTAQQSDFAQRPPLEVPLRIQENGSSVDVTVIVLHMKAQLGSKDDYDRRLAASGDLKAYLEANHAGDKVMVIGDWNDDVDQSIFRVSGVYLASPFANFVTDVPDYLFPTAELSLAHAHTTASHSEVIDHQLITSPLFSAYIHGSALVYDAYNHIPDPPRYSSTTSDHYPVMSRFQFGAGKASTPPSKSVFINEVMPYETGAAGDYSTQFVELVNGSAAPVDLEGWTVTTGPHTFVFPSSVPLAAGQAVALFNQASGIPAGLSNAVSAQGVLYLYHTGTSVVLRQPDGGGADVMSYTQAQAATKGLSMNRSPDGLANGDWVEHDTLSSPGSGLISSPGMRVDGGGF